MRTFRSVVEQLIQGFRSREIGLDKYGLSQEDKDRHGTYPAPRDGPPPAGYIRIPGAYRFQDGRREDAFVRVENPMPFMLPAHCGLEIHGEFNVPPDYSGGDIPATNVRIMPDDESAR
jgi:hypothetical protein